MEEQFVTKDIAIKLKKLGFNEGCLGYWSTTRGLSCVTTFMPTNDHLEEHSKLNGLCTAPLWQQAIDFLEESNGIHVLIEPTSLGDLAPFIKGNYGEIIYDPFDHGNKGIVWPDNKLKALEFGINKALEIIENGKDV